jgi:hypothetical protein
MKKQKEIEIKEQEERKRAEEFIAEIEKDE